MHDDAALEVEDRNDLHRPRMMPEMAPVIGLDVGGANTKAAVVEDDLEVRIVSEPYEVWQDLDSMSDVIADVVGRLGLEDAPVALTTTAELVDVFASKREGVLHVLDAACQALPERRLRVMTTGGELVSLGAARAEPLACAAANWLATALVVARSLPDAILVDCGGTTTDLIPIAGGAVIAAGRTDVERLLAGELVYTGALRTNIAAVLSHVPIGGRPVPGVLRAVRDHRRRLSAAREPVSRAVHVLVSRTLAGPRRARSARAWRAWCARTPSSSPTVTWRRSPAPSRTRSSPRSWWRFAGSRLAWRPGVPVVAVGVGAFLAREAAVRCGLAVHPERRWLPSGRAGRRGRRRGRPVGPGP